MILPFFGRCRRQQMAAIAKKRLRKEMSLCQILEILSVTIFEKKPILLVFSQLRIPMKVVSDSDLIPVTCSEVKAVVFGAKRRWRSYRA
jgi:hypothetical protein